MKEDIKQVGCAYGKWTCGVNKSIQTGDRIFMIKLGSEPKGIVASGYAVSGVFEGMHWEEEKIKKGKKARRIYIRYDKIRDYRNESILSYDILKGISDTYCWSSQASGISIPKEIADCVEIERNLI